VSAGRSAGPLARWYDANGRHDLAWRATRDRWSVLVSEVMLQQTQVARIQIAWPAFMRRFPTPRAMAKRPVGDVVRQWDRLGYPRRARWLWESAQTIARDGWPADLTSLPGIGSYTAAAVDALVDDVDVVALDVNVRRVAERVAGAALSQTAADRAVRHLGRGFTPRDRLLALMDLGALVCTARTPECTACPLRRRCASKGARVGEARSRQKPFAGSFRQRRGQVMAALRSASTPVDQLDAEALASLVADGLAIVRTTRGVPTARLP